MKYKGIIFDFNGVLLQDTPLHKKAMKTMAQKMFGRSFTDEEWNKHILGRGNDQIVKFLKPTASDEETKKFAAKKEAEYRRLFLKQKNDMQLTEGAVELLEELNDKNIPKTIATSSPKENVDFYIEQLNLDKWFEVSKIVYHDGTFDSKPAPDIYIKACHVLNLEPAECIVFEDSPSGIASAKSAGIGKIIDFTTINVKEINVTDLFES